MKNVNIDLTMGFTLKEVPLELPCHSYALGINCDYELGELIGEKIDNNTSDYELIKVLSKELKFIGLNLTDQVSQYRSIEGKTRVIWITRMYIEKGDFICRDYHFRLYMQDGKISEKFRSYPPEICSSECIVGEYSIGVYSVEKAS